MSKDYKSIVTLVNKNQPNKKVQVNLSHKNGIGFSVYANVYTYETHQSGIESFGYMPFSGAWSKIYPKIEPMGRFSEKRYNAAGAVIAADKDFWLPVVEKTIKENGEKVEDYL